MGPQYSVNSREEGSDKGRNAERRGAVSKGDDVEPSLRVREMDDERQSDRLESSRLEDLMQALRQIARLQREATSASVNARQKKREASYKRQDVWMSDGRFMKEVQRLIALGKLEGFEELLKLAASCQRTRDDLGPIEQEVVEVEQVWEGQEWKLREATERLYSGFSYEFGVADSYSAVSEDATASEYSQYESDSDPGAPVEITEDNTNLNSTVHLSPRLTGASVSSFPSDTEPQNEGMQQTELTSYALLGISASDQISTVISENYIADLDSGIGDIDERITWTSGDLISLPPAQRAYHSNMELYPKLLTDFISRRDRISKWLEEIMLISHMEGESIFSILKMTLEGEDQEVPSNWSQLVIAYWELDGAAAPHSVKPKVDGIDIPATTISFDRDVNQSSLSVIKTDFESRGSSNPDHGYFSDNTNMSKSFIRERPTPLRPAPPPPPPPAPPTRSPPPPILVHEDNQDNRRRIQQEKDPP